MTTPCNLIYYQGQSVDDLGDIATSSYTHVLLSAFHFGKTSGVLSLNQTPVYGSDGKSNPDLASFWEAVCAVQKTNKFVGAMVGGGGNGTFAYVFANPDAAAESLTQLVNNIGRKGSGLDGIDLDVEDHYSADDLQAFTVRLSGKIPGKFLTHSPLASQLGDYNQKRWGTSLEMLSWLNVQWHHCPGRECTPPDNTLEGSFKFLTDGTTSDLAIPAEKIAVGNLVGNGTLTDRANELLKVQKMYRGWRGVSGWNYGLITDSSWTTYAECMQSVLAGKQDELNCGN